MRGDAPARGRPGGARRCHAALLFAGVLLASACGSGSGQRGMPSPTVAPTAQTPTPSSSAAPEQMSTVGVFFLHAEHVQPVARSARGVALGAAAVRALLAGPTSGERAAGLSSAVPAGTVLRSLAISGGLATVDLSGTFASGGGHASMTLRVAQLVYTLTRFPSVTGVALRLDGHPTSWLSGEGVDVRAPMTRARFAEAAPDVLVESPLWGQKVTSPLRVSGTADVFEAVFLLEIRAGSTVVVRQRVQATSGTGTRGTFAVRLTYTSTSSGDGTLTAFVYSAKDGSRQNLSSLPVRLGA